MKTYIFTLADNRLSFEAANYAEALAALVFQVGSEAEAAGYIFAGVEE